MEATLDHSSSPRDRRCGSRWILVLVVAWAWVGLPVGCSTVRPMANEGHDLVENAGWPLWVRIPAGLGEAGGYLLALPVSLVLLPTVAFESQAVPSAQGYCDNSDGGDSGGGDSGGGDIWIPLVQAPYEYGGGMGAAVLGWPFRSVHGIFVDHPGAPPGTLCEQPEPPPGEQEPVRLSDRWRGSDGIDEAGDSSTPKPTELEMDS